MVDNIKTAQALPPGAIPDSQDKAQKTPAPAKPVAKAPGTPAPSSQPFNVDGRPTKDEQEQVIRMQQIMSEFGKAIDDDLDSFASRIGVSRDEAIRLSGAIRNTGQGTGTPFDGKWGGKTIEALALLGQIANKLGSPKVNPGKHYKTVNPENVISAAKGNVDAIADMMRKSGFAKAIPASAGARPDFYDQVPTDIRPENVREWGVKEGVPVRPSHLDNIWNFFKFVQNLGNFSNLSALSAAYNNKMKKIADNIVSSGIFKLSQEKPAEPVKAPQQPKGMTIEGFDAAVNWFFQRSNLLLGWVENAYSSGAEKQNAKGEIVPVVTEGDLKTAQDYHAAVAKIAMNWQIQRDKLLAQGRKLTSPLNLEDLRQHKFTDNAFKAERTPTQMGYAFKPVSEGEGDGKEPKMEGFTLIDKMPQGPIAETMMLGRMKDVISENVAAAQNWLEENMAHQDINFYELKRMTPRLLVSNYRGNPEKNPRAFAVNMAYNIRQVLNDMYATWRTAAVKTIDALPSSDHRRVGLVEDINKQRRMLTRWNQLLTKIEIAARNWHEGAAKIDPRDME